MISRTDFPKFFTACNNGHPPFRWQQRLVDSILEHQRWPDAIAAPTGAGKSSVIEVHLFVSALAARSALRLPRRLVAVVNRRALVDNQVQRTQSVLNVLNTAPAGSIEGHVADALRSMRSGTDTDADPFDVVTLRGGLPTDDGWRDDPSACAVICATPDMWGSRALFRGYGSSRLARPRDAGLLTMDTVLVVDEAHLNRQLLHTARRIGQLQAAAPVALGVPLLQAVATTATQVDDDIDQAAMTVGVEASDLQAGSDDVLSQRLTKPKSVSLIPAENWPPQRATERRTVAKLLAQRAESLAKDPSRTRTVGLMVNTVEMALACTEELRKTGLEIEVLVGRMRPADLSDLRWKRQGLLDLAGDPEVDVLVATQTLEVGIDLDLSALVTELAPGGALAQRAGRVNRLGLREDAVVEVIGPANPDLLAGARVGPYNGDDLRRSWEWLSTMTGSEQGLAPWAIVQTPPPTAKLERTLLQRLELADSWNLAATSDPLAAEDDLDLWLHDNLDPDNDGVDIVVRNDLPSDASAAVELLRATPPMPHECFPATVQLASDLLNGKDGAERLGRGFLTRDGEVIEWTKDRRLRPGDVLIVDSNQRILKEGVVHRDGTAVAQDRYEWVSSEKPERGAIRIVSPGGDRIDDPKVSSVAERILRAVDNVIAESAQDTLERRRQVSDQIELAISEVDEIAEDVKSIGGIAGEPARYRWAAQLLRGRKNAAEVILGTPDAQDRIPWMVIREVGRMDTGLMQVLSMRQPITLDTHANDVARRAGELADRLALQTDLHEVLTLAGLHHDDGKADQRFQKVLQRTPEPDMDELLAKSGGVPPGAVRLSAQRLEPPGWRHEQLSVVVAAEILKGHRFRDLILRVIGTSHGRGNPMFRHISAELLSDSSSDRMLTTAVELFDEGGWDDLMERTAQTWGVWGCAYLEAVLRGADCKVSGEN